MELPVGGKVVIIDDCRNEVEPLIDVLSAMGIPVMFYTGLYEKGFPQNPLTGVRIVFLDLRFPGINETTIKANTRSVLKRTVSEENGPYLLITWSSTGETHTADLMKELEKSEVAPVKIIPLSKADYFETEVVDIEASMSYIQSIIESNADIDTAKRNRLVEKIRDHLYANFDENRKHFIKEKFTELEERINDEIQNAGILPIVVVWENAVQNAASELVANLYDAVSSDVPAQDRLAVVTESLAHNVLVENYFDATDEERLQASFMELDELYTFFFEGKSKKLEDRISRVPDKFDKQYWKEKKGKTKESDKCIDGARINTWKLLRKNGKEETPGRVFFDRWKRFDLALLAPNSSRNLAVSVLFGDSEIISKNITYVYLNINGECETAQKKARHMKIIPGIIISKEYLEGLTKLKDFPQNDDICSFGPFYYEDTKSYLFFSLSQCTSTSMETSNKESIFVLNRKFYMQVREEVAKNFNKIGSDLY